MTALRIRRVERRWPFRRRYAVELLDETGEPLHSTNTAAPTAFLVKKAGLHSTDSYRGAATVLTVPRDWQRHLPAGE